MHGKSIAGIITMVSGRSFGAIAFRAKYVSMAVTRHIDPPEQRATRTTGRGTV